MHAMQNDVFCGGKGRPHNLFQNSLILLLFELAPWSLDLERRIATP